MKFVAAASSPRMKKLFAAALLGSFLCLASASAQQRGGIPAGLPTPPIQTGGEIAARVGIEVWLGLLDDGQFDKSWDNAASIVRKTVTREQWVNVLSQHRPALGKVVSRVLKDTRASTSLPGAPNGQYVTAQYDTTFEHKKGVETITSMLDESGEWKVAGYFFK